LSPSRDGVLRLEVEVEDAGDFERHKPFSFDWWVDMTVSIWCLVLAGIMSGLVVGLASIDRLGLEIAAKQSKRMEASAKNIFKVIDNHHWMLVTLLLLNAASLETLPIYLNKAMSEFWAITVAVVGVLFVG
jgi:metal transporter CNNM